MQTHRTEEAPLEVERFTKRGGLSVLTEDDRHDRPQDSEEDQHVRLPHEERFLCRSFFEVVGPAHAGQLHVVLRDDHATDSHPRDAAKNEQGSHRFLPEFEFLTGKDNTKKPFCQWLNAKKDAFLDLS